MTQPGIDVSNYQHPNGAGIDWQAVRNAGKTWVGILCSDGSNFVNPYFARDLAAAQAAGLKVLAYHFGRPGNVAVDEARAFLALVPAGVPVCLDMEVTNGFSWADVGGWAHTFLDTLAQSGREVALYCNDSYLHSMPGAPWGYTLWLADPSNMDPGAVRAATQTGITPTPGIQGGVDQDNFGDDGTFAAFFGQSQVAQAAPQPPPSGFWSWFRRIHGPWGR